MARYPLPVTQFSEKECDQIQKPFIHVLLPKLGMNRNTPRVVIYGPKSLGDLELMDMQIEHATAQWETTKGHMKRVDRAGQGMFITAHNLQVEIGSKSPFYQLDHEVYNYATTDTRWQYLWKVMTSMELKMEIFQFWTPKKRGRNDCNIMDVAVTDRVLNSSKWPLLYHVNR